MTTELYKNTATIETHFQLNSTFRMIYLSRFFIYALILHSGCMLLGTGQLLYDFKLKCNKANNLKTQKPASHWSTSQVQYLLLLFL